MNQSDDIKSRLDIVEVIREYIQVKAAGANFRALCPFHHEKSPSFMISPEKQIWHCFGCGKGGDIFTFVMEIEGISFVEALRILATKAGVTLDKFNSNLSSQRNRLLDINQAAGSYFHKILLDSQQADWARRYLKDRGLSEETINDWRIGCSLESWDSLLNYLKSKGFRDNEILLAGLSVKQPGGNRFYDRFRGRIMFPISDVNGNIVGFTARVNPFKEQTEKLGKYINSPQTMIYDKSKIIFGLDKAKMAIKQEDMAVLVEGQMDVITAHQFGFKNTVATSGTALTADQIKTLKRYSNNIAFALDADAAGQSAIDRGGEVIKQMDYRTVESEDRFGKIRSYIDPVLSYNINVKVIAIPQGKDPDECIKKNPDSWSKAVEQAKPAMQYYFDKTAAETDLSQYEGKQKLINALLLKIIKIGSRLEQDHWLKKLSQRTDISESLLREALIAGLEKQADQNMNRGGAQKKGEAARIKLEREEMMSELLMALILKFPSYLEYVISRLGPDELAGQANQVIYRSLIVYYNEIINRPPATAGAEFNDSDYSLNNENLAGGASADLAKTEENDWHGAMDYNHFKGWLQQNKADFTDAPALFNDLIKDLDKLYILADKDFFNFTNEQAKSEIINIISFLRKNYLTKRMKAIERLIAADEAKGDSEMIEELMKEFKLLADELSLIE